jgi:hypothetical protein
MMQRFYRLLYGLVVASLVTALTSAAFAGGIFAYPLKGQSQEQQAADLNACHQWAMAETGFDPATIPPASGAQGALKGVFVGLLAGGIVAATGGAAAAVAIGAGGGGLIGGILGKHKQAKITAAYTAYLQAGKTCMQAKGYQVSI